MNVTVGKNKSQHLKTSISADPLAFFSSLNKSEVYILEVVIAFVLRYPSVYFSQATLGKLARGYSRRTVNKVIKFLESLGVVIKYYRQSKTCEYDIHPFFKQYHIRKMLSNFLTGFIAFQLILLSSKPMICSNEATEFSQLNSSKVLTANQSSSRNIVSNGSAQMMDDADDDFFKKETYVPREAILKRRSAMTFSQEELEEIAHYPKETVSHAHRKMTREIHQGKVIRFPFKYFIAICDSHIKEQKDPKTGMIKTSNNERPSKPAKEYVHNLDEQSQFLRDRRERIKNKALGMGIDIRGRTIGDLEKLLRGDDLSPVSPEALSGSQSLTQRLLEIVQKADPSVVDKKETTVARIFGNADVVASETRDKKSHVADRDKASRTPDITSPDFLSEPELVAPFDVNGSLFEEVEDFNFPT